jgi:hypothetical protein
MVEQPARVFKEFRYQTRESWSRVRRVRVSLAGGYP